jgi:multiple sugar transport system ATP-binding protein
VTVSDAGGDGLAAEVVLVESLGADSYVHAALAGIDATFVARTEGYDVRQPGTNIRLRLNPDRIYGFDAQTEERLGDPHATAARPDAVGAADGARR